MAVSGGRVLDSFEWNKIAGGVIASVLVLMAINTLGDAVFPETQLEQNVYIVEGVEEEEVAAADTASPAEEGPSLAALLSTADPAKGEKLFRRCAACHNIEPGAGHRTGPNLYNTVGKKVGTHEGFNYSEALQQFNDVWTFEHLDKYLENPKAYIPGNKMAFAGLKKPADRAAVIAFLNSRSDNPLPLPEPEAEEETVPAPAADSEGE